HGRPALTTADQRAHEHTDQTRDPDRAPGIVVHVVVRGTDRPTTANHQYVLGGVQVIAGTAQVAHGAIAQFFRLFAGGFGRLLQHAFGFVQAALDLLDKFLFTLADIFLVHASTPVSNGCVAR